MTEKKAGLVDVAVVGATGLVGEAVLAALVERDFPVGELTALGRDDVDGDTVMFRERPKRIKPTAGFDFSRCRFAFFCVPAAFAETHARRAAAAGCTVIDVSRAYRLQADVPLVAADVNAGALAACSPGALIAAPSAEALQLATVLAPLHAAYGLERVEVTTLLAVSDRGRAGVSELATQTARLLNVQSIESHTFPAQIAFNVMPQGEMPDVGGELRRLLAAPSLPVDNTSIYVPVFYGHSQTVSVMTRDPVSVDQARRLLAKAPSITLCKGAGNPSPAGDVGGADDVLVGRLQARDGTVQGLSLWTLADNVRKSAAVNSVQIAENLLKHHS